MILALSLALLCSVLLGLPVAFFFAVWIRDACLLLWPLDSLYFDWYHFRMLVHQVCAGFSELLVILSDKPEQGSYIAGSLSRVSNNLIIDPDCVWSLG